MSDFVYLASQSPRRRELLDQIGVAYRLLLPDAHEDAEALEAVLAGEAPEAYVQRVTALKLIAAKDRFTRANALKGLEEAPILCADTTVALEGDILGKPRDAQDACAMLARLQGRSHQVFTALGVDWAGRQVHALSVSEVRFAPMSTAQIEAYVASGEPLGKAGSYGVQGRAAAYIAQLSGSYSGIMGLPLFETAQALRQIGADAVLQCQACV
ncbi:MAG: Maf family protein [Rhodoferax sp.]